MPREAEEGVQQPACHNYSEVGSEAETASRKLIVRRARLVYARCVSTHARLMRVTARLALHDGQ